MVALHRDLKEGIRFFIATTSHCRLGVLSSSLAFHTMLSLVPLLSVFLSIFSLFGSFQQIGTQLQNEALRFLTVGTADYFVKMLNDAIANSQTVGVSGLISLVVTSIMLMNTIDNAFQLAWQSRSAISRVRRTLIYLGIIIFGPLAAAALAALSANPYFSFESLLPLPILAGLHIFVLLFFINKFTPHRKVHSRSAALAAFVSTLAMGCSYQGFLWAIKNLWQYDHIYGSFASALLFLLWLYLVWLVVLIGSILGATLNLFLIRN